MDDMNVSNTGGRYRLSAKKVAVAVFLLLCVVFAAVYLVFSIYFQSHFFPGTKINGMNCSGKSVSEVEKLLKKDSRYYVLKLIERDNVVEHISAEDINMQMVLLQSVADIKEKQNPYAWLFTGNTSYTLGINPGYDESMLITRIDNLLCMKDKNIREPSKAGIIYENGSFSVTPGNPGTQLDKEKLKELILQSVKDGLTELNIEKSGCYLVNTVTSASDYELLADTLNRYLLSDINLTFGEVTENVSRNMIAGWMSVGDNNEIIFDREAMLSYLNSLAKKYETFGSNRNFSNSYGKTVMVKGGDYGWWFNRTKEIDRLISDIKSEKSVKRDIEYSQTAASHGESDIGTTYLEICLSKQRLFLYSEGNKILETDIISGTDNTKRETPQGTYRLRYKQKNYTFKKSYFTRKVAYWMVFYGNDTETNIGIISCDWLNQFGGNVYKTEGSDGSIYVKPADAVIIYENLPNDAAIVIYE